MRHRQQVSCLVAVALLSLVSSCKSPSKPSGSEPQVLGRISVALDGYAKDASGVWHSAVLLRNPAEVPVECILGSYPKATGELPEGTQSVAAVDLPVDQMPKSLLWDRGESQMPIPMMKRYGMVQTKVLAPRQSERVLLPLWVTPSHPGKTHNQLLIGIRTGSTGDGPQAYDSYIAELVL